MESEKREVQPDGTRGADRRAFLQMVAGAATGAVIAGGMPESAAAQMMGTAQSRGGHLYMQTNEIRNAIVHYRWATERHADRGGACPRRAAPGPELQADQRPGKRTQRLRGRGERPSSQRIDGFLFTTNGGDNSVSSFSVDKDGRLTLLDVKPTGNPVEGKSGTAKSLAYAPSKGILFVLHSFGPDHLRLMSVDERRQAHAAPGAIHGEYER